MRLQSEKRQECIREVGGERLQGTAEGRSSAPHLASSSTASFPKRNECPGTHCSLIVKEEREDSSCQRETTVCRGQSENPRGGEEKWQTCWYCRYQRRAWRIAQALAKNLEQTRPAKKIGWPQHQKVGPQSRLCQKRKEQSPQSRLPDREM